MTTQDIEKAIHYAERYKMGWKRLAEVLTKEPFDLTAADATKVLDEYKRRFPAMYDAMANTGRLTDRRNVQPLTPFKAPDTAQLVAHVEKKARKKHEHKPSALTRASAKEFALLVSEKKRNGKFCRAGKEFIQAIEADLENIVRDIGVRNPNSEDDIPGDWDFVNHLRIWPKVAEQLNRAIRRRIFERVMSQPSLGKTLK